MIQLPQMPKDLPGPPFVPRPHQVEARDAILAARRSGRPGFVLGDLTGLGKTLSAWLAISAMPDKDVLVICPKGAIPQWRRTIARSAPTGKSTTIVNFERTKSLMAPPPVSTKRSVRAKNNELAKLGMPKRRWPLVVIDESHRICNPGSQQGLVCRQIAAAADFTIYMSATAGQSPHELSYLGKLLASAAGGKSGDMDEFRGLMKRLGIGRAKGRWKNWKWEPNEHDRLTMSGFLYKGTNAIGLRRRPEHIADGRRFSANLRRRRLRARIGGFTRRPGASFVESSGLWAAACGVRLDGPPISAFGRKPV